MNRDRIFTLISLVLLSISMSVWAEIFNFSKIIYLPEWTKVFPHPINAPSYLVLVCLMPVAFVSTTVRLAVQGVAVSVFVAPLFAVLTAALNPTHQSVYLFANMLFNYWWIVLFHCTVPACLLLVTRVLVRFINEKWYR